MHSIYIKIPNKDFIDFSIQAEANYTKYSKAKQYEGVNYIVEFTFEDDLSDIRVRFLAYLAIARIYGQGAKFISEFNQLNEYEYDAAVDIFEHGVKDIKLRLETVVEEATYQMQRKVMINFCRQAGIHRINGYPAVVRFSLKAHDDNFSKLLNLENVYTDRETKKGKDFLAIGFAYKAEDFVLNRKEDIENIEEKIKVESSNKYGRLTYKCQLLKDFENANKEKRWTDTELKFILSRLLKIDGGYKVYKNSIELLGVDKSTKARLEYSKKIYQAKNTHYKCSETNCKYYKECNNKKMYNTSELAHARHEHTTPNTLKTVEEAKAEIKEKLEDIMINMIQDHIMQVVKIPTSLGKTTFYTDWIVRQVEDTSLQPINIIAVPTIKLANQVKATIEEKLSKKNLRKTIYCVEDITPILEKLDEELLNKYKFFNSIGAYQKATSLLYQRASKIQEALEHRHPKKEELKLLQHLLNKNTIQKLDDSEAVYIITHEALAHNKNTKTIKDKIIVIDEDIFETLNKLAEVNISDFSLIQVELANITEPNEVEKEAIKLIDNLLKFFLSTNDTKKAGVPQFIRKTDGGFFDIINIESKKENIFDVIAEAIYRIKDTFSNGAENISNIMGLFESEYIIKYNNKLKYNIRRDLQKAKYILFSATADEECYRKLFETRAVTREMVYNFYDIGAVETKGRTIQFLSCNVSKTSLKLKDDDGISNFDKIAQKIIEDFGANVRIITNKQIAISSKLEQVEKSMYLGNTAGYNDLTGENLCVIGNYRKPEDIIYLYAKSLGIELENSGNLKYRVVEYGGFKFKYYCYDNNEALNHLMLWLADIEIKQAAGRNRNRYNDATTIIVSPIPNKEAVIFDTLDISLVKPVFNKKSTNEEKTINLKEIGQLVDIYKDYQFED